MANPYYMLILLININYQDDHYLIHVYYVTNIEK